MPKRPSLNPFRLIAESFRFLRKQPALWYVLAWFMIVPGVAMELFQQYRPFSGEPSVDRIGDLGYGLATLLFIFVAFWGLACIQVVGRRLIQSKAGRARTSFKSVRRDAIPLIVPLFFTDLLRSLITLQWALLYLLPAGLLLVGWTECRQTLPDLLQTVFAFQGNATATRQGLMSIPIHCFGFIYFLPLLIPAIVYQIRTMFFDVVIGAEGLKYREALRRSSEVTQKKFWKTVLPLVGVWVILFLPTSLVVWGADVVQATALPELTLLRSMTFNIVMPFAVLLFSLSVIGLFGKLRKLSTSPREVKPKDF